MDWTTFKANTLEHVWRTGDTVLDAALSDLVSTAENRLRIDLSWHETETTVDLSVNTYPAFALPTDVDKILAVVWDTKGVGTYITNREYFDMQPEENWPAGTQPRNYVYNELNFTKVGNNLYHYFLNADTAAVDMTLVYEPKFSSLESGDDSLYTSYEALYKAAVYHEVHKFLLNDERAAYYDKEYAARLGGAQTEQNYRKYAGAPLKMQMPRTDVS